MNTGQIDHRFTGVNLMLEVLAQAPIPAQPAECSFDDPSARDDHEALGVHRPTGNLQSPPPVVLDPAHNSFIAPVGPDEFQSTPPVRDTAFDAHTEFLPEQFAACTIGHASPMHHHQHEQPQDIHHDVAFAPLDLLVDIHSSFFPPFRRLAALAVNNSRTGLGVPPF